MSVSAGQCAPTREDVSSAALDPAVVTVEFQGSSLQAAQVLQAAVDRLVTRNRVVADGSGAHPTVRRLRLPRGGEAVLLVAAASDADRSFEATHVLTLAVLQPGQLSEREIRELSRTVEATPFTDWEVADVRTQLPLTVGLPQMLPGRPLADVGVFLTIHHMSDFVAMVHALLQLGVDPRRVTIIDKEYPYALARRVDAYLRDSLGLAVYRYSELDGAIVDHFDRTDTPTAILDDGGYVVPRLIRSHPHYLGVVVGLVEQTASGIWKLAGLELPVPVFSVAESTLKGAIESYGIADAAVRNMLALLPNTKFEGQPAAVLGYGRIGRQVAHVLRNRRLRVGVYDSDLAQLVTAHEEGFFTAPSAVELLTAQQPLVVFGTTGNGSMGAHELDCLEQDCYLVSTTSRDFEFKLAEFSAHARSVRRRGRLGTSYEMRHGAVVTVLGHGFPINFHYAESLPNRYVDLVMGAMVLGAVTLTRPDHGFAAGHNLAATNQVLRNSTLLRRYYQLYGPAGGREVRLPGAA